jgi:hypothetical protein
MVFKYSDKNYTRIEEYKELNSGATMNFGEYGKYVSVFLLFVHLVLSVMHTGLNFNLRHKAKDLCLTSKIDVRLEIFIKCGLFVFACCYPLLQINHYLTFLMFLAFFLAFGLLYYALRMPFYSDFTNRLYVMKFLQCFSICLFFIVGYLLDNATITIVLIVCMQPVIFIASFEIIFWKNNRKLKGTAKFNDFYRFEFKNREKFNSQQGDQDLMEKTTQVYFQCKNELIRVIQCYYYLDVIKNTTLASIKLSLASQPTFSIFTNFQIQKCKEKLEKHLTSSYGIKILKFLENQQQALKKDKQFCKSLLRLLEKIQESTSTQTTLESLIQKSDLKLSEAKKKYKELIRNYPDSTLISKIYGSFLLEVTGKASMAHLYLSKSENTGNKKFSKEKYLEVFYDESVCVAVFGYNGKILNMNSSFCNFLEIDSKELKSLNVKDLLPAHKDFDIEKFLFLFVESCSSQYLHVNQPLFLKNKNGFLKECLVVTECFGYDSTVHFVSVVTPRSSKEHHSALLYEDGTIFAHTEGLAEIFNFNIGRLEMMNIQDLVDVSFKDFVEDSFKVFNEKSQMFSFLKVNFAGCSGVLMTVFTDSQEISMMQKNDKNSCFFYDTSQRHNRKKSKKSIINTQYSTFTANIESIMQNHEEKGDNQENKQDEKETNAVSTSSRHKFRETNEWKYIKKTFKFFQCLKILIGLLVTFIQAAFIISLIIAVCIISKSNISKVDSLDPVLTLGKIGYDFSLLALFFRTYFLSLNYKISPVFNLTLIENTINDLEELKKKLPAAHDYLHFCPVSEITKGSTIPEIKLPKLDSFKKINLHNYITNTQIQVVFKQARKALQSLKEEEIFDAKSICYLIFNSYKIVGEKLLEVVSEISTCEEKRIQEIDNMTKTVIIGWLVSIGSLYVLVVVFYFYLDRRLNIVWNMFFLRLSSFLTSLKGILINRLASTHNFFYLEEERFFTKRASISFNYWIKYALTTSVLVFIALGISLLFIYLFDFHIITSLTYRKSFIEIPLNRRVSLIRMSFTTVNRLSIDYPIRKFCSNYTNFKDQTSEFMKVQKELNRLRNRFAEDKIIKNVPSESWNIIFAEYDSQFNFIKLGITSAMNFLKFESFLYWSNQKIYSFTNITGFLNDCFQMSVNFNDVIKKTDEATDRVVTENFRNLVIFSVLGIFFTVLVSGVLYLWFFRKEIKLLKSIHNSLLLLIESEVLNTK